jgi:hypothetical protein
MFAPLLFLYNTNNYLQSRLENCIEICLKDYDTTDRYYDDKVPEFPAKRDYQIIELNGNDFQDSLKLLFIENYAKAIEQSLDYEKGIKVIFGKNLKYNYYIQTIDKCLISNINTFVPWGDTIFIYHGIRGYENDDLEINLPVYLYNSDDYYFDLNCIIYTPPVYTLKEKILQQKFKIKTGLPFAILYVVLVFLAIKRFRQNLKN